MNAPVDMLSSRVLSWHQRPVVRLLLRVVICTILFCAAHLLGFRQYTALLSGTMEMDLTCRLCGAAYILLYAGMVLMVPIWLIAAAILAVAEHFVARRKG